MWKIWSLIVGLCLVAAPSLAQELPLPSNSFAYVEAGKLVWVQNDAITPIADSPYTYNYNAVFAPDGTQLAYTTTPSRDSRESQIWVANDQGGNFLVTTQQLAAGMPISWTDDGRILFMRDNDNFVDGVLYTQVYAITPTAESAATPELLFDNVEIGVGCGGGSSDPIDLRYWAETDLGGSRGILQLTAAGLIYSGACAGGMTTLLDAAGSVMLADGNLVSAVVAPDGKRLAGIVREPGDLGGKIVVYELPSLAYTEYTVTDGAWQLGWSTDGNLYYSSAIETGNLLEGLTAEQVQAFGAAQGYVGGVLESYPRYEVRLYRLTLADGSATLLYSADAARIGRIAASGDYVFFSQIPNGDAYLQAILDGELTFETNFDAGLNYVQPAVVAFLLSAETAQPLYLNAAQFAVGR
jgi:hypothetical protein